MWLCLLINNFSINVIEKLSPRKEQGIGLVRFAKLLAWSASLAKQYNLVNCYKRKNKWQVL